MKTSYTVPKTDDLKNLRNQLVLGLVFVWRLFFGTATGGPLSTHVVHSCSGSIKTGDIPRSDVGTNIISISLPLKYSIVLDVSLGHDRTSLFRSLMTFQLEFSELISGPYSVNVVRISLY